MNEILQTSIQLVGLIALIFAVYRYLKDRQWNQAESSFKFYNDFDANYECRLAMFMLDYDESEFEYQPPKSNKPIKVNYSLSKRNSVMHKKYEDLDENEQIIRFIFDVYIGYLERIFFLYKKKYFHQKELFFYKYWLDKLISEECIDIMEYAKDNSCGIFVPFLNLYKRKIQKSINRFLNRI